MAASRKQAKYTALSGSHMFQTAALETPGPINESAVQFLNDLGHRITSVFADDKEGIIPLPATLYRSADIQRYIDARVVWVSQRPGPLCIHLF